MKNAITIRAALLKDIPQILPLMAQLGYPQDPNEFEDRFRFFLDQPGYGIAVAEESSRIIGCISWSQSFCLVVRAPRFRIEALIVDSDYRGQGVGKILMEFFEDSIEPLRPCILELTSGLHREKDGSHDFYKSLGYFNEGPNAKLFLRKMLE